jgi:hypothetical protein
LHPCCLQCAAVTLWDDSFLYKWVRRIDDAGAFNIGIVTDRRKMLEGGYHNSISGIGSKEQDSEFCVIYDMGDDNETCEWVPGQVLETSYEVVLKCN